MKLLKHGFLFIAIVIACFVLLTFSCGSPGARKTTGDELSGTISISGAWALYPITVKWSEEFRKLHPKVRIDISAGGAGKGLTDALTGMVDLGMFSRGLTQAELDQGVWYMGVTKDAVIPVISKNNPYLDVILQNGVSRKEFQEIYLTQTITNWSQLLDISSDEKIHVYTRSDASGAAQMWAEYLGKHQENLLGTGVFGDPGVANAVKNDPLGIGYNNVNFIYDLRTRKPFDGLAVIPIDLDEDGTLSQDENFYGTLDELNQAIRAGVYPAPPARPLYFVAKEKPQKKEVIEFLRFILTQGQMYVEEAGYVILPQEFIDNELKKLQ